MLCSTYALEFILRNPQSNLFLPRSLKVLEAPYNPNDKYYQVQTLLTTTCENSLVENVRDGFVFGIKKTVVVRMRMRLVLPITTILSRLTEIPSPHQRAIVWTGNVYRRVSRELVRWGPGMFAVLSTLHVAHGRRRLLSSTTHHRLKKIML